MTHLKSKGSILLIISSLIISLGCTTITGLFSTPLPGPTQTSLSSHTPFLPLTQPAPIESPSIQTTETPPQHTATTFLEPTTVLIFSDDFSDPGSGWVPREDENIYTDYYEGGYRIFIKKEKQVEWTLSVHSFVDVRIEVEAKLIGGGVDNMLGVICRYQDSGNFYALVISSDGFYSIQKRINGGQLEVISGDGFDSSDHINLGGESNQITAECIGEKLSMYVNGFLLAVAVDSDIQSGDVGLIAGAYGIPSTDVLFDNFIASSVSAIPAIPQTGEFPLNLLFSDSFDNIDSGWDHQSYEDIGSTGYNDGVYRIGIFKEHLFLWANPSLGFTDVVVEIDAVRISGGDDNQYGIICRHQDVNNFYTLVINSNGSAAIRKRVNGEMEYIADWVHSDAINLGDSINHIQAECIGDTLTLLVNGARVLEAQDSDFPFGDVGLLAGTFSASSTEVIFDNFQVFDKP